MSSSCLFFVFDFTFLSKKTNKSVYVITVVVCVRASVCGGRTCAWCARLRVWWACVCVSVKFMNQLT